MADLPPQYQPYQIDDATKQQVLSQQRAALDPQYQAQIQTYNNQQPIIQNMYAAALKQANDQLASQQQQNQAATTNQIGNTLQGMANRGMANSTFANSMQYNANQALANRNAAATQIRDNQALNLDNQRQQQVSLISQAIAKLQAEEGDRVQQGLQNYIAQQNAQRQAAYDDAWKRYSAQAAQDQAAQQRALQLQLAGLSHGDALQAHQDAINQQNMNNWIGAWQGALQQAAGQNPDQAQNTVYRFLQANQGAMKAQGVDPNALGFWNTWQQMRNGAQNAPAPAGFHSTGSFAGDYPQFGNATLSPFQSIANYFGGNNKGPYQDWLTNPETFKTVVNKLAGKK